MRQHRGAKDVAHIYYHARIARGAKYCVAVHLSGGNSGTEGDAWCGTMLVWSDLERQVLIPAKVHISAVVSTIVERVRNRW